jgi:hypothetical protein
MNSWFANELWDSTVTLSMSCEKTCIQRSTNCTRCRPWPEQYLHLEIGTRRAGCCNTNTAKIRLRFSVSVVCWAKLFYSFVRFGDTRLPTASYISTCIIFQFSFHFLKTVPFLSLLNLINNDAQIKMKQKSVVQTGIMKDKASDGCF